MVLPLIFLVFIIYLTKSTSFIGVHTCRSIVVSFSLLWLVSWFLSSQIFVNFFTSLIIALYVMYSFAYHGFVLLICSILRLALWCLCLLSVIRCITLNITFKLCACGETVKDFRHTLRTGIFHTEQSCLDIDPYQSI